MKRILLVFTCFLVFQTITSAQDTLRVLFLGNSYTASNNLASIVEAIADSQGKTLIRDVNTPGGYTLEGHTTNATSQNKIAEGTWDYVVLQEQSQLPSFPPSQVSTQVLPFAEELVNDIRVANPCTEPMFFMTWGRENGDQNNCEFYEPLCTYEGMQGRLTESYTLMAMNNQAIVSPVGVAWKKMRETYPDIGLYSGDGSHPGIQGSYVAACAFYSMLFGESMEGNYYIPNNIDAGNAEKIREIVDAIVFDPTAQWNFSVLKVEADANHSITDNVLTCMNNVGNATAHSWDFGDGNTSNEADPIHSYASSGIFEVSYTAINDCDEDIFSFEVNSVLSGIEDIEENHKAKTYPNPFQNTVRIETTIEGILQGSIFDISGKEIMKINFENNDNLDLSDLSKGVYYLMYSKDGIDNVLKLVKD